MTYNIGYCGMDKDVDFLWMEARVPLFPLVKKNIENLEESFNVIKKKEIQLLFLQEVDKKLQGVIR